MVPTCKLPRAVGARNSACLKETCLKRWWCSAAVSVSRELGISRGRDGKPRSSRAARSMVTSQHRLPVQHEKDLDRKNGPSAPCGRSQRRGTAEVVARLSATGDWAGTFVQEDRCGCLKSLHLCGWVDALTSAKR